MSTILSTSIRTSEEQRTRLLGLGYAVNDSIPGYELSETLARFQAANGLVTDGEFGPVTQAALFGYMGSTDTLTKTVLRVASAMVGVSEVPAGSNRGPQIDQILKSVGLGPGYAWCAAFLYWCFREASRQLNAKNPCPKSAGVLNLWSLAGYKESGLKRITAAEAKAKPDLIGPGMQFILKLGATAGHTGIIESVSKDGLLTTIEGNSNNAGGREGVAVYRLQRRTISSINVGFVVY